jgi:hypothetical protein
MFLGPNEGLILVSEVVKWASDSGVVLDPNAYVSYHVKKHMDILEVLARQPVTYFCHLGVI